MIIFGDSIDVFCRYVWYFLFPILKCIGECLTHWQLWWKLSKSIFGGWNLKPKTFGKKDDRMAVMTHETKTNELFIALKNYSLVAIGEASAENFKVELRVKKWISNGKELPFKRILVSTSNAFKLTSLVMATTRFEMETFNDSVTHQILFLPVEVLQTAIAVLPYPM